MVFKLAADLLEFVFGEFESIAVFPIGVNGHEMNVSMGDVGADDFPDNAGAELFLHVLAKFLHGVHKSMKIFLGEIIDFVDLDFRHN